MGPVLVTEHGAVVHSMFVGLGVAVAGLVLRSQVRRAGLFDERFLVVVAGTFVGGALGMRAAGPVLHGPGGNAGPGLGLGLIIGWAVAPIAFGCWGTVGAHHGQAVHGHEHDA